MVAMRKTSPGPFPPLPAVLTFSSEPGTRPPKRERTRRKLITAAARVYTARGIAKATIREIAAAAEMTPVTIYNHFRSEAEIVQAVAIWIADMFCRRIVESYASLPRGAERMAIGCRRFIWLAGESPAWALLVSEVAVATPALLTQIGTYILADLRLGIRQNDFRVASEAAALDLISGAVIQAMRRVGSRRAPRQHAVAVVTSILSGLGVTPRRAREFARRPLPALRVAKPETPPVRRLRSRRSD